MPKELLGVLLAANLTILGGTLGATSAAAKDAAPAAVHARTPAADSVKPLGAYEALLPGRAAADAQSDHATCFFGYSDGK